MSEEKSKDSGFKSILVIWAIIASVMTGCGAIFVAITATNQMTTQQWVEGIAWLFALSFCSIPILIVLGVGSAAGGSANVYEVTIRKK